MVSLSAKFEVNRPKDVQEPGSYILSGTFDYVLDHRVKIEIQTRLPCISIPYSARITKKFESNEHDTVKAMKESF